MSAWLQANSALNYGDEQEIDKKWHGMSNVFYNAVKAEIKSFGYTIVSKDFSRPWGGFLLIDENQAQAFAKKYFNGIDVEILRIEGKLSPKTLIVKPEARLSWQHHHRRAEIWQVFRGTVGIIRSKDDIPSDLVQYPEGAQVKLA